MASISTTLPDNSENIEINMAYLINHITKVAVKTYYLQKILLTVIKRLLSFFPSLKEISYNNTNKPIINSVIVLSSLSR
jgi:urate oxidase